MANASVPSINLWTYKAVMASALWLALAQLRRHEPTMPCR